MKRWMILLLLLGSCSSPSEPDIVPTTPAFVPNSVPPDPIDHGIYGDVDPSVNAIWIEWQPDSTRNTSGYVLWRANDSTVAPSGLLADSARSVAQIETTDQTIEPLQTSYRDTLDIVPGATYFYQLQAYHRSPTGKLTYSAPTHPGLQTSFHYTSPVIPLSPNGAVKPPATGLNFSWADPEVDGTFQIIVERTDSESYVWSQQFDNYSSQPTESYPQTATPLVANGVYRWRVKRIIVHGGSSSRWTSFKILP